MSEVVQNISFTCFGLSYLLALTLEFVQLKWPRRGVRLASLAFGIIGLFTHSVYLAVHHPSPALPYGAMLSLAWVLAVFYLYGTLHHPKQAWGVFVLPVVFGLVVLSLLYRPAEDGANFAEATANSGEHIWGVIHGILLLFASVGISVGFLASVMYLVQAARLRNKANPMSRFKLLSLERLEAMNRRAVNWSFPMLTLGLLLGVVLLRHYHHLGDNLLSVKVIGTLGLWVVFLVLVYLRYATHVPGRRLAVLTMIAFGWMMVVLASAHPFVQSVAGEGPR